MKALSLRPHWAHAIFHMGKDIETRSWRTSYRGPLLIHAAKGLRAAELDRLCAIAREDSLAEPHWQEILVGGIIGVVTLIDIIEHSKSRWFGGQYAWVLANPRRVGFHAVSGQVRLFECDHPDQKPSARRTTDGQLRWTQAGLAVASVSKRRRPRTVFQAPSDLEHLESADRP